MLIQHQLILLVVVGHAAAIVIAIIAIMSVGCFSNHYYSATIRIVDNDHSLFELLENVDGVLYPRVSVSLVKWLVCNSLRP